MRCVGIQARIGNQMTWLTAITKLAPFVIQLGEIGVRTLPIFTKSATASGIDDKATPQQITELQSAATQNAENIRTLASDLKSAIAAIEQGGETIEARFRRLELLSYFALALSVLSALSVLALWLR